MRRSVHLVEASDIITLTWTDRSITVTKKLKANDHETAVTQEGKRESVNKLTASAQCSHSNNLAN